MWRFEARCHVITVFALAASIGVVAMPLPARADGLIGNRFLPSSLAVDDPFVADELSFTLLHFKTPTTPLSASTVMTSMTTAYAKRVTENLGLTLEWDVIHLAPDGETGKTGISNLNVELKYEIFESAEHEALLSSAVGVADRRDGQRLSRGPFVPYGSTGHVLRQGSRGSS